MTANKLLSTQFLPILWEAFSGLRMLGSRTLLALLGIILGCGSIVALINIGNDAKIRTLGAFENMGTDTLVASFPRAFDEQNLSLSKIDTTEISRIIPKLNKVATITVYSAIVQSGQKSTGLGIIGSSADLFPILNIKIKDGRFFNSFDKRSTYAVLGKKVAEELSTFQKPIRVGSKIQISEYQFEVIGLIDSHADNPLLPFEVNKSIFITAESMSRFQSPIRVDAIAVKSQQKKVNEEVAAQLEELLKVQSGRKNVYIQVPQQLLDSIESQSKTFSYLLIGLGGISLIVGGGGVMNVMLMSVSQRRKEIGLRMALGATSKDVLALFITEAACMSILGAVIGGILGILIAVLFTKTAGWEFSLAAQSLPLGIGSSVLVGVAFGIYPAITASRLLPVQALRDD